MSLPKRRILSPLIPGSRTPEQFRRAVEEVVGRRKEACDWSVEREEARSPRVKPGFSTEVGKKK